MRDVDAANRYHSYIRGWKHAAATKAMDPTFTKHTDQSMVDAYTSGYHDGCIAKQKSHDAASKAYGHTPNILRLAKTLGVEDGQSV